MLEARAPKLGLNLNLTTKNLIILLMCLIFTVLFIKDGFYGYPKNDDAIIAKYQALADEGKVERQPDLFGWKGWWDETDENRRKIDQLAAKLPAEMPGWKSVQDINTQRWVTVALLIFGAGAMWRFVSQLRLRVTADDAAVSPRAGVVIPWDKITKVDNTRWHTYGIVKITYTDATGASQTAEFDDYKSQREPLLKILDLLGEKAVNAEFIPKAEAPPAPSEAPPAGPSAT